MQGGVDTVRLDSYNASYCNRVQAASPIHMQQIHKFSPPAFTSLIDLCRDISALQITSEKEEAEEPRSPEVTEDEFILLYPEEENKEKIRRSSSLKSARTSGQKKIVRFADVLGLDLADVHTFLDEVPRIPKSAFKDLKNIDFSPVGSPKESRQEQRTLIPLFLQPGSQAAFPERLARNKVCLENAYVASTLGLFIRGTIRVVNLDFTKHVAVRYSSDKWKSFTEIQATYVDSPHDGFSDRFGFTIPIYSMDVGSRLEFAVKYTVLGEEIWDNNSGANYTFQCVPEGPPRPVTSAYVPSSIALETWGSFY